MATAQAAVTTTAAAGAAGSGGPLVPDDPGLNPAAPAELLHLGLPPGALLSERWGPRPGAAGGGRECVPVADGYSDELFAQRFGELSFKTLLTQPEVIGTLVKIRLECAKVRPGKSGIVPCVICRCTAKFPLHAFDAVAVNTELVAQIANLPRGRTSVAW